MKWSAESADFTMTPKWLFHNEIVLFRTGSSANASATSKENLKREPQKRTSKERQSLSDRRNQIENVAAKWMPGIQYFYN